MQDLLKVNIAQLFAFWRNLAFGLVTLIGVMFLTTILPYYLSPIVALLGAAFLYTLIYNNRLESQMSCMVLPYTIFFGLLSYSFVSIVLNILYIWGIIELPKELTFFNAPYIPSLLLDPICLLSILIVYLRRNGLQICLDCKMVKGLAIERGKLGEILHHETKVQLLNLAIIFGILSVAVWAQFLNFYDRNSAINDRDAYVFFWLNIIVLVLDMGYFAARYYNIYLDLKESGDIITEEELQDMTVKTYLRFYVVCGESVYVNTQIADPKMPYRKIIDTPFVMKRNSNGIETSEIQSMIKKLTNVPDGQLRFFFGRRDPDLPKHSLLRYFYFLNGNPEDYGKLKVDGEWMDFARMKAIYNQSPTMMAPTLLSDISRLTTIVLTQKIFDPRGYRKVKAKSYHPSYTLAEIRNGDFDFQDDKWIRVAMFNSDSKGFYVRRMWKKMIKGKA